MNTSSVPASKATLPSFSDIPYVPTILRAMAVARWMSLDAPVEMSPSIISSAALPPSRETICSVMNDLER